MAYSYYIYYRVDPDKTDACEPKVRELLAAVKDATGVSGRLLKKRNEPLLWMEIYENVSDAEQFELELSGAVVKLGVQAFLQPGSGRRPECFIDGGLGN